MLILASSGTDIPDSPVTEIPHQPETPVEGGPPVAEPCQKLRHERREKTWLRDC